MEMQLGLSSFTFGWACGVSGFEAPEKPLSPFDLLEIAGEFGANLVQFGDNLPLHALSKAERKRLYQAICDRQITLEIGARGLTDSHLAQYISLAHELNAPLLRFVIDAALFEPSPETFVWTLRNALPALGKLKIGIENHDRFPAQVLAQMIEKVGDERVGICLDTANSLGAGEGLKEIVPILSPHTLNWHIKDYKITRLPYLMGFSVEGRPAGRGDLDLEFVWRELEKHGRCKSAILELWTPPEPTMAATIEKERAWARESWAFLKGWRFP